ncbi:MAG: hypothetical protein JWN38_973 [Candidatus Saccharibacteria bacterium]|nr:hypothetical protein [Candidatus Saccharibacteria bacterium]
MEFGLQLKQKFNAFKPLQVLVVGIVVMLGFVTLHFSGAISKTTFYPTQRYDVGVAQDGTQLQTAKDAVWQSTGYAVYGGTNVKYTDDILNITGSPQLLYQTQRKSLNTLKVPNIKNGSYRVGLYFADTESNGNGQRVMDIYAEAHRVVQDLDVHRAAGGADKIYGTHFDVIVKDGTLTIGFKAIKGATMLSAFEVTPLKLDGQTGTVPVTPLPAPTCPGGQTGTPPNCVTPISPACTATAGYAWNNLEACGWPGAANTGVPASVSLVNGQNGDRVLGDNAVLSGENFTGRIIINGSNVVIRNLKLTYDGTGNAGYPAIMMAATSRNVTIENVEINGDGKVHICVKANGIGLTIKKLNCYGVEDGISAADNAARVSVNGQPPSCADCGSNITVTDSYFHDFIPKEFNNPKVTDQCSRSNGHVDGFQLHGGNNLNVSHNTFKMVLAKGKYKVVTKPAGFQPYNATQPCPTDDRNPFVDGFANSAFFINDSQGDVLNGTISDNLVGGGGFAAYAQDRSPSVENPVGGFSVKNVVYSDNKFSTAFGECVGAYGIWYRLASGSRPPYYEGPTDGWHRTGNVILETGANVDNANPSHANGSVCR